MSEHDRPRTNPIEAIVHAVNDHRISPETAITWLKALIGNGDLAWPEHLAGWVLNDDDGLDDCEVIIVADLDDPDYLPF